MNKAAVHINDSGFNPITALSNKMNQVANNMGARGQNALNVKAAVHMQGKQHEHELTMQSNQHGHEIHKVIAQGAIDLENNSQNNRHERRMAVLSHNNGMEASAAAHHNDVHKSVVDSLNQLAAERQKNDHETAMKNLADVHAGNASSRATSFLETVHKHAAPGTQAQVKHGDASASFTLKAARPAPQKEQTAPETAAPAAEAPAKQQKYAHRDPLTNKISHYEDKPQVLDGKKKTVKKAAPKKKK